MSIRIDRDVCAQAKSAAGRQVLPLKRVFIISEDAGGGGQAVRPFTQVQSQGLSWPFVGGSVACPAGSGCETVRA